MSRFEELMQKLLNDEPITETDFPVMSRLEKVLIACINKTGTDGLGIPQSRAEELLQLLSVKMTQSSGGSSGEDMMQMKVDGTQSCKYLFEKYTGDNVDFIKKLDTSNVTDMSYMFLNCSNITSIPKLDTSNATNMNTMFCSCEVLTSIPELDTSKVTTMNNMFYNCHGLTSIPKLDTSNVTDMGNMFGICKVLTSIPELDTSKVTTMANMFYKCHGLTSIPKLGTSKVTTMANMFQDCVNITSIPELDTSKVTSMTNMFDNCQKLTTVSGLNMISLTYDPSRTFNNCKALTNLNIINIKNNLTVGSGTSYGHLLTLDSLICLCKECINVASSRKLTVGTANLEKLANVYVKFTDSSKTSLTYGEKGEVEVCESTDEGAMTITEYMTLKQWTLA